MSDKWARWSTMAINRSRNDGYLYTSPLKSDRGISCKSIAGIGYGSILELSKGLSTGDFGPADQALDVCIPLRPDTLLPPCT